MQLTWKESIELDDGKHIGEIVEVTERKEPYHYIDIWIQIDDTELKIKYGCPATLSPKSKLGRLLIAFGAKFEAGKELNPETFLKNKRVKFMTMRKPAKDGNEYVEIVDDSVKPEIETIKV